MYVKPSPTNHSDSVFLPDFCAIRMVFAVVVIGELLAFILALTPTAGSGDPWGDVALISLFVQWVGLSSAGLICLCRRWWFRLGNLALGIISYGVVLVVTAAPSEAAYWLVQSRLVDVDVFASWQLRPGEHWFVQPRLVESGQSATQHLGFVLRNVAISAIVGAVALRYFYVQYQWKINVESEARARIQALQSRIRPHFLFNSMNTIASLTRSQPDLAEQVVEDLADLFRVSLGDARVPVPLGRELAVCRQYVRIEELRLGERLAAQWHVDGLPADALLPALCLQPLVENAIYHGIEPAPEGGLVRIMGERSAQSLEITVSNTLPADMAAKNRPGNKMAQENVRQRLIAFFGPQAKLDVTSAPREYQVRASFPYVTEQRDG